MEGTTTIKIDNGELYVRGDTIVGRKVIDGNFTYYYRGDLLHNENGPAVICMQNGVAVAEQYMIAGVLHNESGPAVIRRYNSGTIRRELYAIHGKIHRADAPAFIWYNTNGSIITSEYWVDGIYKSIKNNGNSSGELATLKKELEAARADLEAVRAELGATRSSLAQAERALEGMQEERDSAFKRRDYHIVANEELSKKYAVCKAAKSKLEKENERLRAQLVQAAADLVTANCLRDEIHAKHRELLIKIKGVIN